MTNLDDEVTEIRQGARDIEYVPPVGRVLNEYSARVDVRLGQILTLVDDHAASEREEGPLSPADVFWRVDGDCLHGEDDDPREEHDVVGSVDHQQWCSVRVAEACRLLTVFR